MRATVGTLTVRLQVNLNRLCVHYLAHRHQLFVAVDALQTEFEATVAVLFVAVEAIALLEVIITVTADANERTFRPDAIRHELMGTDMIATDKLLHAPKQRSLLLQYVILNASITAGIVVAAVWEKVYVSDCHSHTKATTGEWQRIGVYDIHIVGIVSIKSHHRIGVTKQRLSGIETGNSSQCQTEILLQIIAGVATQVSTCKGRTC